MDQQFDRGKIPNPLRWLHAYAPVPRIGGIKIYHISGGSDEKF